MFSHDEDWSISETLELIALVEKMPDIYDPSRPGYSDENKLEECWKEISKSFTTTFTKKIVKALKSEWQVLRDSYCDDRHRIINGNNEIAKPSKRLKNRWVYSRCLQFLEPHTSLSETCNNNPVAEEQVHEAEANNTSDKHENNLDKDASSETSRSECFSPPQSETSSNTKKRKHSMSEEASRSKILKQELKTKPTISLFFDSIVEDMEQLTPEKIRRFKLEVLSILNNLLS